MHSITRQVDEGAIMTTNTQTNVFIDKDDEIEAEVHCFTGNPDYSHYLNIKLGATTIALHTTEEAMLELITLVQAAFFNRKVVQ